MKQTFDLFAKDSVAEESTTEIRGVNSDPGQLSS